LLRHRFGLIDITIRREKQAAGRLANRKLHASHSESKASKQQVNKEGSKGASHLELVAHVEVTAATIRKEKQAAGRLAHRKLHARHCESKASKQQLNKEGSQGASHLELFAHVAVTAAMIHREKQAAGGWAETLGPAESCNLDPSVRKPPLSIYTPPKIGGFPCCLILSQTPSNVRKEDPFSSCSCLRVLASSTMLCVAVEDSVATFLAEAAVHHSHCCPNLWSW